MRTLLTLFISLCVLPAFCQEKVAAPEPPRSLEEAHQQLETLLTKADLMKIDAMSSENQMVEYHLSIGMAIRHKWGLWGGSALANNLWQDGFSHPDDMSDVILRTFWCKRHRKDFRLEERADYYEAYWRAAAAPPADALDPADHSPIEWTMTFDASTEKKPRQIHIGKSKKSGRWLAYEFNKGVYLPDDSLAKRIRVFANDPFSGKK